MNNYTILFMLIIIQSCSWVTNNNDGEADVLARVDNSFLYKKDISYDPSMGDSSDIYSNQINRWIKKQLILNSAYQNDEIMNEIQNKNERINECMNDTERMNEGTKE